MENEIVIEIMREHVKSLYTELNKLEDVKLGVREFETNFKADANIENELIKLIITPTISGVVGGVAGAITTSLLKKLSIILSKCVKNGYSLSRITYNKKSIDLEARSFIEVEQFVLELKDDQK